MRELLGELYGGVNGYCGRPTQSQIDATAGFQKKLDEAASQFQSIAGPALESLNAAGKMCQAPEASNLIVRAR